MHNTEDKQWWCFHGNKLEESFVSILKERFNKNAEINPEKVTNKYSPDLIVNGYLADLKTQNTPFFMASRYGFDPRYTVTFNRKDYERYKRMYPDLAIYFWIEWTQTEWNGHSVEYLGGIYACWFDLLKTKIESGESPEHFYQKRTEDKLGNAKSSFLFDVRQLKTIWETK